MGVRAPLIILALALSASVIAAGIHDDGRPDDHDAYAAGYVLTHMSFRLDAPWLETYRGKPAGAKSFCPTFYQGADFPRPVKRADFIRGCMDAWAGRESTVAVPSDDELGIPQLTSGDADSDMDSTTYSSTIVLTH